MFWIIGYFVIGVIFSFVVRTHDDEFAAADPGLLILFLLFWPFIFIHLLARLKRIKINGKVIWERKRKV